MILLALISLLHASLGVTDQLEAEVREAARAHLAETFPEIATRLDVRVSRLSVDAVDSTLRVAFQSPGVPKAHAKVNVLHRTPGGWEPAGWALLYVSHFDSVAVPVRDVARGEDVGNADVAGAWVETTRFYGTPIDISLFRARVAAEGIVADRTLRAGEPIRMADLRAPWAVETGGAMTVLYERPGLALRLKGHAREPGAVGDAIRVYCADTGATYRVEVTDVGQGHWLKTL